LCALASGPILRAVPLTNQSCLDCHEQVPPEKRDKDAESNPAIEILRPDRFAKSVHGKLLCVDCHAGITGIPHDDKLPPAQCAPCHEKEAGAYAKSIHGMSHAMGASGADAAVQTADVVLMSDSLLKVPEAISRGRRTRAIVRQNIVFALGVKGLFLVLGAVGIATMWEAVIADMGVALLAIANAVRAFR